MANTLNLDLIQTMVTNYKTKQYLSIVTNTINPMTYDAQSVWFDLAALKSFIATMEDEVAKHPDYDMGKLGVRFYYSAYPDNSAWEIPEFEDSLAPVPEKYEKLHTLIAIPTGQINGLNSDFDPYDVATYKGDKPVGVGLAIMAENHGDLTPPATSNGLWF